MQSRTRTAILTHHGLPATNAAARSEYTLDVRGLIQRRGMAQFQAATTEAALWSRRVLALDNELGQGVGSIEAMMRVQGIILVRQEYARRALVASAGGLGSGDCPRYVMDPSTACPKSLPGCGSTTTMGGR